MWSSLKPELRDNNFTDNQAEYGRNFASFPKSLSFTKDGVFGKDASNPYNFTEIIVSGQLVTTVLSMYLTDTEGQTIYTDNSTVCEITADNSVQFAGFYKTIAQMGKIELSNFIVTSTPGKYLTLTLECTKFDPFSVKFLMRACVPGEYLEDDKCTVCQKDFYSFDPSKPCKECDEGAICYGNNTVGPIEGYWRSHENSETFYECPLKEACLGSDDSTIKQTGACEEGYYGVMCSGCVEGYSLEARHECKECNVDLHSELVQGSFLLSSVLFGAVSIILTLKAAARVKSTMVNYIKVLVSFMQVAVAVAHFNSDWPPLFQTLLDYQILAGRALGVTFNINCYFVDLDSEEAFYKKVIIASGLPLALALAALFVWVIIRLFTKVDYFKGKVLGSVSILIFISQTYVIRNLLEGFACRKVEGEYLMNADLTIKCWADRHLFSTLAIALPSLIIWMVAVPSGMMICLYRRQRHRNLMESKMSLGFIYQGYKSSLCFWEAIVFGRKALLIAFGLFFDHHRTTKEQMAFLTLYLSFVLNLRFEPFAEAKVNLVEELSILASASVVLSGLYLQSEESSPSLETFLFIVSCLFLIAFALTIFKETLILQARHLAMNYPRLFSCFRWLIRTKTKPARVYALVSKDVDYNNLIKSSTSFISRSQNPDREVSFIHLGHFNSIASSFSDEKALSPKQSLSSS
mmetsp:Transcript_16894/g.30238  ORF Transcript_16894/g.30238 Transcript_16894/m.30238 type:complete len:691 (+) Transcript_16894:1984-4056(+)